MPDTERAGLTPAELARSVQAADPAALLVPPRILRRVIRQRGPGRAGGLLVPHRKSFVCPVADLLAVAEPAELGLAPADELPTTVLLLTRPDAEILAALGRDAALLKYWRLLFHARVHLMLEHHLPHPGPDAVRARIARIGEAEFAEIRDVLRQERFLLAADDDWAVYVEFAAVFLELRYFAPDLVPLYFPSLQHPERVEAVLAVDLDAPALFAATRLPGAPDPRAAGGVAGARPDLDELSSVQLPAGAPPSPGQCRRWRQKAARALDIGNDVRAALLYEGAARAAAPAEAAALHEAALAALDRLVNRLQTALQLEPDAVSAWVQALRVLLEPAAAGLWPREARLLYDVQKVCVDHERPVYALDLVEWAVSLGQRPVRRPLPGQEAVLALKHLRIALKRLHAVRLPGPERRRLAELLQHALHAVEHRVRARFRPRLCEALAAVRLEPANFPERVARDKLVEELLDRVVERAFISMGDVRDAVSRNQLKLPDLSGGGEWLRGDPLIRTNRRLAVVLDGVYHRGEIYLRWLQRFSSLGFGTAPGRFLTRYLAIPFGGAFFILEGTQLLVEEVVNIFSGKHAAPEDVDVADPLAEVSVEHPSGLHLLNWYSWFGFGLFLLALLHVPAFRRQVAGLFGAAFAGLRWLLCDLPARVLELPPVRQFFDSRFWRQCKQFVLKPLAYAVAGYGLLRLAGVEPLYCYVEAASLYVLALGLLNSRMGRDLEETAHEWLLRTWRQVHVNLIPGVFWLLVGFFKRAVEGTERVLYTVDEWLRFRTGEGRLALFVKPVLGLVWFFVTYLVRVFINLFVEPTFNPIKHFPVVTVAAKMILPFIKPMGEAIMSPLVPLFGKAVAGSIAGVVIFFLPGLAGFLVWEFKENWRLYRANRPKGLRPVLIGHHGETMLRLLRPGFHSGTLPKLFAKLRKARRKAFRTGKWRAFRTQRTALHHVGEALRRFVEREFLAILNGSKGWGPGLVRLDKVELATNLIRLEFWCPGLSAGAFGVEFREHAGWLLARVYEGGWLAELSPPRRQVLTDALAGAYKLSGVDLVAEQLDALLGGEVRACHWSGRRLVIRVGDDAAAYDLDADPAAPQGPAAPKLPALAGDELFFSGVPLTWEHWVEIWEQDQAGKAPAVPVLPGVRVLPVTDKGLVPCG